MHERIIGLYEENAAAWDRQRGRGLFEKAWLDRLLTGLPAHPGILDVGCGMGEPIAGYLIGAGAAVTGVDSSPSLIALCRERFPEQEWIVADMRTLDLGRSFDGLIAWHSFFHLRPEDQPAVLASFAAHVRPEGQLMFTTGRARGAAIGTWQGEPLYHGSLDPSDYAGLLEENGFAILEHRSRDPECGGATVWLARKRAARRRLRQIRPASGLEGSA